jgi:hypothetical protein
VTRVFEGNLHGDEAVTFVATVAQLDAILEASNRLIADALNPSVPDQRSISRTKVTGVIPTSRRASCSCPLKTT